MKKISVLSILVMLAVGLSSCVKETLYSTTTPDKGHVRLKLDWSEIGSDASKPSTYRVTIGDDFCDTLAGDDNLLDFDFLPGNYRINIHNLDIYNMDFHDNVAIVDVNGGLASEEPGWLFTYANDIVVRADEETEVIAVMRQHTRDLNLVLHLKISDLVRVDRVEGVLEGVGYQLEIDNGNICGTDIGVKPAFNLNEVRYNAFSRILGVDNRVSQIMKFNIYYNDQVGPAEIEFDLTEKLNDFNTDKAVPLTVNMGAETIGGILVEVGVWKNGEDFTWFLD